MKNFLLLITCLLALSSCALQKNLECTKPQSYDGTYKNHIEKYWSLWSLLTDFQSKDTSGIVTIQTLDKKTLLASHTGINSQTDSILIKGSLKKDLFRCKKQTEIRGIPLVAWGYNSSLMKIHKNKNGNTVLRYYNSSTGFFFIIPAGGGDDVKKLMLKKLP